MQLTVLLFIHEFPSLMVSVDVEELFVDEERDNIAYVALIHYLIDYPNSQFSLPFPTALDTCFYLLAEINQSFLEDFGSWGAIHLRFQGHW